MPSNISCNLSTSEIIMYDNMIENLYSYLSWYRQTRKLLKEPDLINT